MQAIEWLKLYAQNYGDKLPKFTTLLNANFDLYIYIYIDLQIPIGIHVLPGGNWAIRKIKISFLMVGHTLEDVDQVFSK